MGRSSLVELCAMSPEPSGSSDALYSPVGHDVDDDDEVDPSDPYAYRQPNFNYKSRDTHFAPQKPSVCPQCCLIFSLTGFVFLILLSVVLASSSSKYIRLHEGSGVSHEQAKSTCIGAAVCYFLTAVYCWYVIKFRRPCCPNPQQIMSAARRMKDHIR